MTSVDLTPAQVHELDQLHADVVDAQSRAASAAGAYRASSRRMYERVQEVLERAGVPEGERAGEWRMVVEGDAVRLVLAPEEPSRE